MIRIFIGVDHRQPIAYHVLSHSILRHASVPVAITPLNIKTLPIEREGLTEFTFTRYLVPHLCNYEGKAIFMDSDMLVLGDVARLDTDESVSFVHFDGEYLFERPSVMVFDCSKCTKLTPEYIECGNPQTFEWADSKQELNPDWNFLVNYEKPRVGVNLLHYTQGIPLYKECVKSDYAKEWFNEFDAMNHFVSWLQIMGQSVHAKPVLEKLNAN